MVVNVLRNSLKLSGEDASLEVNLLISFWRALLHEYSYISVWAELSGQGACLNSKDLGSQRLEIAPEICGHLSSLERHSLILQSYTVFCLFLCRGA